MFNMPTLGTVRNLSFMAAGSFLLDTAAGNFPPDLIPTAQAIEDSVAIGPHPSQTAKMLTDPNKKNLHLWKLFLGLGATLTAAGIAGSLWRKSRSAVSTEQKLDTSQTITQPLAPPTNPTDQARWHAGLRSIFISELMSFVNSKQRRLGAGFQINFGDTRCPYEHEYYFFTQDRGCVKIFFNEQNGKLQIEFAPDFDFNNHRAANFTSVLISMPHTKSLFENLSLESCD